MSKNNDGQVRYFDKYVCGLISGCPEYDFKDKLRCIKQHMSYMFNRTQSMFKWDGLPDTIPVRSLELYLQINGNVCFYKHNNDLYVFTGGLGGKPNAYYMPTIYTIANPALNLSVMAEINKDCIVIPNDSLYIGLLPMFSRYATAMTESELSLKIATINSRIIDLISAPDDRTKDSAEKYLEKIVNGDLGVIGESAFFDGVKAQPYGSTGNANTITNLIELEQYLKASWFNELGLNANYNMKRESINAGESQLNFDSLLPLIDDMLACRKRGIIKVNEMFNTNISVSLNSSWKFVAENELKNISGQSENVVESGETDDRTKKID